MDVGRQCAKRGDIRSGIRVEEDVPVFQVLRVGPVLEVLLERVSALHRGDGRLVYFWGVGVRHVRRSLVMFSCAVD